MRRFLFPILLLSIVSLGIAAQAQDNAGQEGVARNPFFTLSEQKYGFSSGNKVGESAALYLGGIFISQERRTALINGQVVKEGDVVGGREVTAIRQEEVVLTSASGSEVTLRLPALLKDGGQ
jgi:hypothetical protein